MIKYTEKQKLDAVAAYEKGTAGLDARAVAVIRVDAVWLAIEPLDMRAGTCPKARA